MSTRTFNSLRRRGFVDEDGNLTRMGAIQYRQIMASGNGPEALKAMFWL